MLQSVTIAVLSATLAAAQGIGSTQDAHPKLTTYTCTKADGCKALDTSLVLDSGFRWLHQKNGTASCTTSSGVDPTLCPDPMTCAQNCVLESADYAGSGVSTAGASTTLKMYKTVNGTTSSSSPRVYLLGPDSDYVSVKLLGQEISFDVDVSKLVCGMNGAFYLSEMDMSGGRGDLNPAGAAYGTGYCDAQCFTQSFLNGVLDLGGKGACCQEMDLWEANARANALTPHACNTTSFFACSGDECGSKGVCDKSGCGYNPYNNGEPGFYGYGGVVDTTKPFTVTTQFLTDTGDATGKLVEIRRLYVQDGVVIHNAPINTTARANLAAGDSITDPYCKATAGSFQAEGGLEQMGKALGRGMVLIASIWNDNGQFMHWLDSGNAGPCNATEGDPALIQAAHPDMSVTFANIKWGDINSTYGGNKTTSAKFRMARLN